MNQQLKKYFSFFMLFTMFLVQFVNPHPAQAACGPNNIIYVNITRPDDAGNGCSWATAKKTLQGALAIPPASDDQIWVASGTYTPGTLRTDTFQLMNGVKVYGGFTGSETLLTQRNPTVNVTILSGDIGIPGSAGDNSYHVVTGSGTISSAVLDGFTITAGNANGSTDNANGGGLFSNGGSPTLSNLIVSGNTATNFGGGIYNTNSNPTITNVTISNNSATSFYGGGMFNNAGSPSLTFVIFSGNTAQRGAGMYNNNSINALLSNVVFRNNIATTRGGGIFTSSSTLILTNVTFSGNRAQYGGGIQNIYGVNSVFTNVTFNGNAASTNGGAMSLLESNPTLINVTISGNTASSAGGGVHNDLSSPTITNSIIYGNTGGEITNVNSSTPNVTYSVVGGGYAGTGNTGTNPLLGPLQNNGGFTDTMALPVPVVPPFSSAINSGTNSVCPSTDQRGVIRPQPTGGTCDIGAYELDTTAPTVTNVTSSTADGVYGAGSVIVVTVTFSEAVTVTGTPQLNLETGATDRITNYTSGSGTNTLTFNYTVQAGDTSPDLDYVATNSLALNAGTIQDAASNNATLTLPAPGAAGSLGANKAIVIDTTAPTVTIVSVSPNPTNAGTTVTWNATENGSYSVRVGGTDCTDGTVAASGIYSTSPGNVASAIDSGNLVAGPNTLRVCVTDAASNIGSITSSVTKDITVPSLASFTLNTPATSPTNADTLTFLATFSEAVTGVDISDFVKNSSSTASVTNVTQVTTSTYTVTISGGDLAGFNGTVNLNLSVTPTITDLAGNPLPAGEPATDETYTVDNIAPTVTIVSVSPNPTNAGTTVTWNATENGSYSVRVGGTDCTDGTVAASGIYSTSPANVASAIASGNLVAGLNTLRVCVTDASSNTGSITSSVTKDTSAPTVTINQAPLPQTDPTNTSPINFIVVFSEPVTGFTTGDVTLSGTAVVVTTTGTVTQIAPNDGTTYRVAVSGMGGDGTVTASIGAGVAFDTSNNGNTASTSTDNTVTYNTGAPDTTIDSGPANPTTSQDATFTFSSPDADLAGFECRIDGGSWTVCTSPLNYTGLSGGSHTFDVRAVDTANNVDPTPASYTWMIDLNFPTVIGSVPPNNSTIFPGPIQLTVQFSENVKNDSSPAAANNAANYLLVEAGVNLAFDTLNCAGGLGVDDIFITVDSATYSNNGGSGPFVATLAINGGISLPLGTYRLFVCGTTSIEDLVGYELNDGLSDATITFTVAEQQQELQVKQIPATGFPQNEMTMLPSQPASTTYTSTDLWLEIPRLNVKIPIVGVLASKGGWDVTWLDNNAGWLDGSAFPTWSGNSVITAHVWDALNRPGPFAGLKNLKYGDQIKIYAFGQVFIYELRENTTISPNNVSAMLKHKEKSWITLVTCEDYKELSKTYSTRRLIRAVLVNVTAEK